MILVLNLRWRHSSSRK